MKKNIAIILIIISIICIILSVFVGNGEEKQDKATNISAIVVDTPNLTYEVHEYGGFEFMDFSVSKKGNTFMLFMNILNNGEALTELKQCDIILYNSYGKEISRIFAEFIDVEKNEEFQLILSTTDDISTATDFKIEFKN